MIFPGSGGRAVFPAKVEGPNAETKAKIASSCNRLMNDRSQSRLVGISSLERALPASGFKRSQRIKSSRHSQQHLNTRKKFLNTKGLHEVVVSTGVGSLRFVFLLAADTDHQNRCMNVFAQPSASLKPADAGHLEIEQDHIYWTFLVDFVESLLASHRFEHAAPGACKYRAQSTAKLWIVVYQQNLGRIHG